MYDVRSTLSASVRVGPAGAYARWSMVCDPGRRFLEAAPGVRRVARIRALGEGLRSPADVDALDCSELLHMRVWVRRVTRQASVFAGPLNTQFIEVAGGACRERLVEG